MSDPTEPKRGTSRLDTRLILIVVATVLLTWFALENLQSVTIHFWLSTTRAPLIAVIAISAVLGGAVGAARKSRRRHKASTHDH